jgi:intein-encoded DNA endonuclease-like protein
VIELKRKLHFTREELERLYSEMGMKKIAEKYGVNVYAIQYWIKKFNIPTKRKWRFIKPNLDPSPELSYVIGAILGDGTIAKKLNSRKRNLVEFNSTDPIILDVFNISICKVLGKKNLYKIHWEKRGKYRSLGRIAISSQAFWEFMRQPQEKLLEVASKYPVQFLRGFFDAEGSSYLAKGKQHYFKISCSNSNLALLTYIKKLLEDKFGIHSTITVGHRAGSTFKSINGKNYIRKVDNYNLVIHRREDVLNFILQIGFSTTNKIPDYDLYTDELKLDFDNENPSKTMDIERIGYVARILRINIADVEAYRTAHGIHVKIKTNGKIHPFTAVLIQTLMGSDYAKECYDAIRVYNLLAGKFNDIAKKTWNVLFYKKLVNNEVVSQEKFDPELTRKIKEEVIQK